MQDRTKQFALRIIKLTKALPKSPEATVIGTQLLRSATSIAANYRASCRSRSKIEFVAKLGLVIEEADESVFWLELIIEAGLIPKHQIEQLLNEANELVAIMVASRKSASKK